MTLEMKIVIVSVVTIILALTFAKWVHKKLAESKDKKN